MIQKRLVSVAEFAKMADKPKAEVYSILEKAEYQGFLVVENGLKKVDISLLELLNGRMPEAKESAESQPKTAEKPHQSTDEARDKETITALSARIAELEELVIEKDKTIQEMSLKMAEMAMNTQAITEKALNAVSQQQYLTAITAKKLPWYKKLLGVGKMNEEL